MDCYSIRAKTCRSTCTDMRAIRVLSGDGGGGVLQKYQEFQAPPNNIRNFNTPKKTPLSVP